MDIVNGRVTNVVDGDTFDIKVETVGTYNTYSYNQNERVRIANINQPERGASGGFLATLLLRNNLAGKFVRCSIHSRDTYGRLVCDVTVIS